MLVMDNETSFIRRDLSATIMKLFFNGTLLDEVDNLPVKLYPKTKNSMRCCIYKDRAMIRYRIMALLGISIEEEDDEALPLSTFAAMALRRNEIQEPVLTVIDMACHSCLPGNYHVTELCRGCVARPCMTNCPKDAITITNGKSNIDYDKCVNCGKCEKVCPYNAIVYTPVPCESKCPVDAIYRGEDGREEIDYSKCIYCGRCTRSCPFGAIMERSQILDVAKHLIDEEQDIIVMIAPSIVGQFPGDIYQCNEALAQLGFKAVFEVAVGADITAKHEALELVEKLAEGQSLLGTSCCPAYTEAVKKHIPDFEPYISSTKTPMAYTAELAKVEYPNAKTVFVGPCIAKKYEGIKNDEVDYVLTYEELGSLFMAKDIDVAEVEGRMFDSNTATASAKGFAVSNGVTEAVKHYAENPDVINPLMIDGLDRKGLALLKAASKGKVKNNLIEVMSCEGGCMHGPGVISNPRISCRKLKEYAK